MTEYTGNNRRNTKWELKKEISVGDLLFFLSGVAVCVTAYFSLDKRVAIIEIAQIRQIEIDRAQDQERTLVKADLHEQLVEIKAKLDWIIEAKSRRQNDTR